jgi:hypothetical protein
MAHKFFTDERPHKGVDYPSFLENSKTSLELENPDELNENQLKLFNYKKINLQRSKRVNKTFKIDEETKAILHKIDKPQIWMVITEDWCGDSAQNLPYLFMLSELSNKISLKILPRDENLDIIDLYLTNGGSRSIPKLVSFDEEGNELFQWGPRPKAVQDKVKVWKSDGQDNTQFAISLHSWYAKDKGESLLTEIKEILSNSK